MKKEEKINNDDLLDANFLPADHPLLARMQRTLEQQLKKEEERVKLEFIQKTKILNKLEIDKENIGVQLYENQQKLVELQKNLESKHTIYQENVEFREKNETTLKKLENQIFDLKTQIKDLNTQLLKRIEELSRQNLTIKEIEIFNENLSSEIKVKRRITYKIEENIIENERLKNRQDYLIYSLMEEQKRIQQQRDLLEVQLKTQSEETISAREVLRESQNEIDKIIQSKKLILNHLQKATIDLEEKNKTLMVVKDRVQDELEILLKKQNEILGQTKEINNLKKENSKLSKILDKLEKEGKALEVQSAQIEDKMAKTEAKNDLLIKACNTTEDEIKVLQRQAIAIKNKMNNIEGNIMKFHTEIKRRNEEVLLLISNHKTKEKLQHNIYKKTKQIEIMNQEKQLDIENLENEISRINLDILNTQNQIIILDENKINLNKERESKEQTINEYEIVIRENHDAHERKMHEVAKFNREHDKAKQKMDLIGKGPSEVTLIQLNKGISEFHKKRKKLEGDFIKSQTRAVDLEIKTNNLQEKIINLKRKISILEQKKLRLNRQYIIYEKDIKALEKSLKNYEKDMNKLNDFLAVFKDRSITLSNQTININSEFIEKLKDLEKESARLEVEIDRLKHSKAGILEETMECERQILLWDRKIELEKEMQATLDPSVGQKEIFFLKNNLHRKKLKFNELKKKQEMIILEIEKIVNKRDNINLKYNANEMAFSNVELDFSKKNIKKNKKCKVSKNIQLFKSSIKKSQEGVKKIERQITVMEKENIDYNEKLEDQQNFLKQNENIINETKDFIKNYKIKKLCNILNICLFQKKTMSLEKIIKRGKTVKVNEKIKQKLFDKVSYNKKFLDTFISLCENNEEIKYVLPYLEEIKEFTK